MRETRIGHVKDYFARVGVAGIEVTDGELHVGDTIHIKGHTTDLTQEVDSIEFEHHAFLEARAGQVVGIKVRDRVRPHDQVFKVAAQRVAASNDPRYQYQ